ncbi:MAG: N-acetyltransferase [Desulfobacterales bacterium]|nr:N-acetyltransferase [Desulfobacterales bacterium]MDD4072700.1 N-acetyltransferase [Desulfobacterales bacterium]MDD4393127.1 N-acetyltransferase [Desulfobacterales bacterium]
MKIRKLTAENYDKVSALLRQAFPDSTYEVQLVEKFHQNDKAVHEWVCIHTNTIIAYIAFSNAYNGDNVCGLHLAPLAVAPEFQKQGIGSELLRFALRQAVIKEQTIFVLGDPNFYQKFGFDPCVIPICPFDKKNTHFLSIRNKPYSQFTVGYESEFNVAHRSSQRKKSISRHQQKKRQK